MGILVVAQIFPVVMAADIHDNFVLKSVHDIEVSVIVVIVPHALNFWFIPMLDSGSSINVIVKDKLPIFFLKCILEPLQLVLCITLDLRLIHSYIVGKSVKRKHAHRITKIISPISTIFKGTLGFVWIKDMVWLVIHEPEFIHEVIKFLFFLSEWWAHVVLAIIISKGIKYWGFWKIGCKDALDRSVGLL